jgi:hypothetical protein
LGKVLGFSIAAVLPFLVAGALLTPRSVTASLPENIIDTPDEMTVVAPGPSRLDDDQEESAPADLFGNPVSDAVARYKFDAAGSLYELHSPQTELPRLGSPKS